MDPAVCLDIGIVNGEEGGVEVLEVRRCIIFFPWLGYSTCAMNTTWLGGGTLPSLINHVNLQYSTALFSSCNTLYHIWLLQLFRLLAWQRARACSLCKGGVTSAILNRNMNPEP